jgi:hypothetical protein
MTELILHEWSQCQNSSSPEMRLMCARGILMLLHIEELDEFDWFEESLEIMSGVLEIYKNSERL